MSKVFRFDFSLFRDYGNKSGTKENQIKLVGNLKSF